MTTPIDLRAIIAASLAKRERGAKAALARELGITAQSLSQYLAGQRDLSGERVGKALAMLGLEVRPRANPSKSTG